LKKTREKILPSIRSNKYTEKRNDENTIMDVLKDSLEKNVLVLGKDSDDVGMGRIDRIAEILKEKEYNPIILKKSLPEIKYLSFEDKMLRVGALCRFIIVEDSRAAGQIDEIKIYVQNASISPL
jgi:hypothetical protein